MAELGPAYYDCNPKQTSCTRKAKQPRQGCPNCEYTVRYKAFRAKLDKKLKETKATRAEARKWNAEYLLETVYETSYQASLYKQRGPKWTIVTATLVAIYRNELDRIKQAENWKINEDAKARARQQQAQQEFDYDGDE